MTAAERRALRERAGARWRELAPARPREASC